MKICIPIEEDKGLESIVCPHFGAAPAFLIVETDTNTFHTKSNNAQHAHGMCQPLAALAEEKLEGFIVGGIGQGAVHKLRAANIKVYRSEHAVVKDALAAFKAGKLEEISPETACSHHGHGHS